MTWTLAPSASGFRSRRLPQLEPRPISRLYDSSGDRLPTPTRRRPNLGYVVRPEQFRRWLRDLDDAGVVVHNPTTALRWNMHTSYLIDLAAREVPVVPTELVHRGDERSLARSRAERGWTDVVLKPAIGGACGASRRCSCSGASCRRNPGRGRHRAAVRFCDRRRGARFRLLRLEASSPTQ
jgi:hypothetical protein